MADFTINGIAYQSKMIDGEAQVHLMRRLLPAFSAMVAVAPLLAEPADPDDEKSGSAAGHFAIVLAPVTRELASLSDKDVDFIINACMDATSRQVATGAGWAPVRQNGAIQHQGDKRFATRLQIAWNVIAENFAEMFASFGIDIQGLMSKAGG